MAQDYYDPSDKVVFDGDLAKAVDLNSINTSVDTAFNLVGADLDTLTDEVEASTLLSESWGNEDQGTNPDPLQVTKWSAKAYAEEAEGWAIGPAGVATEADGSTIIAKSSKDYAMDTAADVVSTNADVVITNADVVSTNADALSTAADVVTTQEQAILASEWSQNPEDVEVEPGKYSAYHWSQKAYNVVSAGAVALVDTLYPITVDNTDTSLPIVGLDDSYMKKFGGR